MSPSFGEETAAPSQNHGQLNTSGAAQEREALYQAIIEGISDGFFIADTEGRILDANAAYLRQSGYDRAALLRLRVQDLDAQETPEETRQHIERVVQAGGDLFETVHRTKSGELWPVEINSSYQPIHGGRFFAFVRDLRKRKRTERMLQQAQEAAGIGSFRYSIERHTWTGTPLVERILGLRPGEERTLETWRALLPESEREATTRRLFDAIESGTRYESEYRIRRANDGEERWVLALGDHEVDAGSRTRHLVGTIQDITERKRREGACTEARRLEVVGRLAGGVAHDLNNLLLPLRLAPALLRPSLRDPDLCRLVDDMESGVRRAATIVQQLLVFARGIRTPTQAHRLETVLQDAAHELRPDTPDGISLEYQYTPELPPLLADPPLLTQALRAVCLNSIEAMPDGGRLKITLHAENRHAPVTETHPPLPPGTYQVFTVQDDGCGMDAAKQERIFDPFFTTKKEGHGLGLGLPAALGIVRSHAGGICVRSAPGAGTSLSIFLPQPPDY